MAKRFAAAGHEVVLWNRDRVKAEKVAGDIGADVAATAAEAAAASNVAITSLADDAAVRSVYLGESGVAAGIDRASVAVETSTVAPETIQEVGAAVDAAGAGFVESPVSGSVASVESGSLTVMAAGDDEQIALVEPVLSAIAKRVIQVGARGNGAAAKLAVNGLVHGLNLALSEALVLAEKAGVEREVAYEVFVSGAGGAPFVQYKREAYENPEGTPVAFSLDLVAKDLELITALGHRVGAPMAQAERSLEIVRRAIDSGMGDRDMSALAVFLRGEGH